MTKIALKNVRNYLTIDEDDLIDSFNSLLEDNRRFNKYKELIKKYGLSRKGRNELITLNRVYLVNEIYNNFSVRLCDLQKLFNRDHSTIVFYLHKHKDMMSFNNKYYLKATEELRKDLESF